MALGRYTGPTARLIAERLADGRPKFSGGWYRVRGVCHKGDPRPDGGSLSIRDGKDRLIVHCFKDCDRRTVIEALESTTGWTIWNAWESGERRAGGGRSGGPNGAVPEVERRRESVAPPPNGAGTERHTGGDSSSREAPHRSGCSCETCRIARARRLWTASARIKTDTAHPARRWMAARNLYWPRIPVPTGVRWVEKSHLGPRHEGAGAVAVLFAPPGEWIDSWPSRPPPAAVELIHVDSEGRAILDRPVKDGGRPKRTHGVRRGSVAMFGNPLPSEAPGLNLAEGAADALALAARLPETAVAVGGVGGMGADPLGEWLTGWLRVNLYADNDARGLSIAGRLRRLMVAHKVVIGVFTLGSDYKDAADFAADNPFDPEVDLDAARELAADLAAEGTPAWEAARLAVQTVGVSQMKGRESAA